MVQMLKAQEPTTRSYVVVRAICIDGKRVEPGATVQLSRTTGTELAAASKVAPEGSDAANAAKTAPAPSLVQERCWHISTCRLKALFTILNSDQKPYFQI